MGHTQLKIHLGRLVELEVLGVQRDSRRESAVYELRYGGEGKAGESFVVGLRDAATLGYDDEWSGLRGEWSGRGRPVVGVRSAGGRGDEPATSEGGAAVDVLLRAGPRSACSRRDDQHPRGLTEPVRVLIGPLVASASRQSRSKHPPKYDSSWGR